MEQNAVYVEQNGGVKFLGRVTPLVRVKRCRCVVNRQGKVEKKKPKLAGVE